MFTRSLLSISALYFLLNLASAVAINLRFPYGKTKVRGVGLGGWLVLEGWITPSLYQAAGPTVGDEWTFGQAAQSNPALKNLLTNHWETFITENDFIQIKNAGLNHVRIPIGYWAFNVRSGEPYISGQYLYLQKAIGWASNHGLKVLIDLHGLPGSQNGFDNSGHTGPVDWPTSQANIDLTNAIIRTLAHEFSQNKYANTVVAIAPANEPASFKSSAIIPATKNLYQFAYSALRHPFYSSNTPGNLLLVLSDAFMDLSFWNGFMTAPAYQGVAMDHHSYGVFSAQDLAKTWDQHIASMCDVGRSMQNYASHNLWTIAGEWTLASTDCAGGLNGRDSGAHAQSCVGKSGSSSTFAGDYKVFMRKFYEAQTTAYELADGWIHWTWKVENADDWSYSAGLRGGWIPYNPAEKIYGNLCNY